MTHDPGPETVEHLRLAAGVAGLSVATIVAPRDVFVELRGLRLHYLDWGTDGARPVVFLHGGALTAHSWDLVCLALRDRWRCLALDLRGHGDSAWSDALDYGLDAHAQDVAAFIAALGLVRPVLVGQSLGGLTALLLAGQPEPALGGLVVVDTAPSVRRDGVRRIADFVLGTDGPESLDEAVARAHRFNPRRDPRLLRRSLLHNLRAQPDGRWTWKYDRRHLTAGWFDRMVDRLGDLSAAAARVRVPALVVRGAESDVVGDAEAEALASAIPNARWARVDGAGHTVQGDNPQAMADLLREFLEPLR